MARISSDHFFACYNSQGRASGNKKWKGYTQYRLVLVKSINSLCNLASRAYENPTSSAYENPLRRLTRGVYAAAAHNWPSTYSAAYGRIIASLLAWVAVWEILKALLLYIARFPRTLRDRSNSGKKCASWLSIEFVAIYVERVAVARTGCESR